MSVTTEHIDIPQEPEPSSFRLISSLGIAGFFSGLLLVSAFIYTRPLIEANKKEALRVAIFKVLPGCDSYSALILIDNKLIKVSDTETDNNKSSEDAEAKQIFAGFDSSGSLIGFAIPASEPGFQDIIGAIYGFEATKQIIIGFEVLESKETPGLGDKIFKDPDFKTNFIALSVEPEIVGVKKNEKTSENEVETITGATISSKAVIRMLNNSMEQWMEPISIFMTETDITAQQSTK